MDNEVDIDEELFSIIEDGKSKKIQDLRNDTLKEVLKEASMIYSKADKNVKIMHKCTYVFAGLSLGAVILSFLGRLEEGIIKTVLQSISICLSSSSIIGCVFCFIKSIREDLKKKVSEIVSYKVSRELKNRENLKEIFGEKFGWDGNNESEQNLED